MKINFSCYNPKRLNIKKGFVKSVLVRKSVSPKENNKSKRHCLLQLSLRAIAWTTDRRELMNALKK